MGEQGLAGVADPSTLFLGDRLVGAPGSAVTVPVEGHRPLLVEVQALVGRSAQVPRRLVTGLDPNRVGFLVAVLDKRAGVPVGDCDVYVSVAGGARAWEPAADLAVCLAVASSWSGRPLRPSMVALGEVGLGGELRRVGATAKRLAEAGRLGFTEALVPGGGDGRDGAAEVAQPGSAARERAGPPGQGLARLPAASLAGALDAAFGPSLAATHRRSPRASAARLAGAS
jgi:DNA repair protein RadA/Sms